MEHDPQLAGLTMLGNRVDGPVDAVEVFPAPAHLSRVRFRTSEVCSLCPVTGQPDVSDVVIDYVPGESCIESKSLKLFLWSFRDKAIFAEALAGEIGAEVMRATEARGVRVLVVQHARGGIVTETVAELGDPPSLTPPS
jgi:7-cyano-7-deazaguanine reductase